MRIPAVLVVSAIVVAFAWSYGPAWAVFGALAVGAFAFLGIRQYWRGSPARPGDSVAAAYAPGCVDGGAGGCGDGGAACGGGGDGGACS